MHNMVQRNFENNENPRGNKKIKLYWVSILAGVALMVAALVIKNKGGLDVAGVGDDNMEEREELTSGETGEVIKRDETVLSGANYLEGILYNSEDPNRGNLKLISKMGDVYLKTSRDFSNLVGFRVLVFINGTYDNFELLDIQSKITDEGFIRAQ